MGRCYPSPSAVRPRFLQFLPLRNNRFSRTVTSLATPKLKSSVLSSTVSKVSSERSDPTPLPLRFLLPVEGASEDKVLLRRVLPKLSVSSLYVDSLLSQRLTATDGFSFRPIPPHRSLALRRPDSVHLRLPRRPSFSMLRSSRRRRRFVPLPSSPSPWTPD